MSNEILGYTPALRRLALIDGQDFFHEFTVIQTLPEGSTVALEILNRDKTSRYGMWSATDLVVRIDAADHASIPPGAWFRLWVTYPADGGRVCWMAGPVERNFR